MTNIKIKINIFIFSISEVLNQLIVDQSSPNHVI